MLANKLRHARTKRAVGPATGDGRDARIAAREEGIGFDGGQPEGDCGRLSGPGLLNTCEHTSVAGASERIESRRGRGRRGSPRAPSRVAGSRSDEGKAEAPETGAAGETKPEPEPAPKRAADRPIRVLLVDDHAVTRDGLARLLAEQPGMTVVGEAATGKEAVECARRLRPEVVLMDVAMPEMDGVEATRLIKERLPATRVIALSMLDRDEAAAKMLQAGAEVYLAKDGPIEDLLRAIRGR